MLCNHVYIFTSGTVRGINNSVLPDLRVCTLQDPGEIYMISLKTLLTLSKADNTLEVRFGIDN